LEDHSDVQPTKDSLKSKTEEELHIVINEAKEVIETLILKEKTYVSRFKVHHKISFAFVVFFAINLLWYGMWDIVSEIPILSNPFVALITGAIILIGTGYFYENLISSDFNKEQKRLNKNKPGKTQKID
jgi:hypothetical protein